MFRQFGQIRCGDTAFRFFSTHMHFDEDAKFLVSSLLGIRTVQALGKRPIVNRINGVEGLRGASGLVALQVADEMPGSGQIRERAELALPLLNAVFAKVAESGAVGFANRGGGMRFGNADQKNFFRFSRGA
jgi:hypothetical protein